MMIAYFDFVFKHAHYPVVGYSKFYYLCKFSYSIVDFEYRFYSFAFSHSCIVWLLFVPRLA